jgi:hypothetical protein
MKNLLKLSLLLLSTSAIAKGRLDFSYGYFSINSKTEEQAATISNPTAFNAAYLYNLNEKTSLNFGYSLLLADFAASDKGYGFNMGVNYYPLSAAINEKFNNSDIEVERFEIWKPYLGFGFYQRNFQSIKDSYAGFGLTLGVERFYTKKLSFKSEIRIISLSGSNEAKATELNALFGLIYSL